MENLLSFFGVTPRVPLKQRAAFTRKLATLLKSGLPIHEALAVASVEAGDHGKLRVVVGEIRGNIHAGETLSQAMAKQPSAFDNLYASMIFAGEESGRLVAVLERLAAYLENQTSWRNKMLGIFAYPVIMLILSGLAVSILYIAFVPEIAKIFQQTGRVLPWPTRAIVGIGALVSSLGLLWLPLIGLAFWQFGKWQKTPRGSEFSDRILLQIPVVAGVYRDQILSRFARTFATLLSSGITLVEALQIAAKVANNSCYEREFQRAVDLLQQGGDLSTPLAASALFPASFVSMVATGERSGELPEMLEQAATAFDRDIELKLNIVARASEPLLMVMTAAIVLFVALSVMLPMFQV